MCVWMAGMSSVCVDGRYEQCVCVWMAGMSSVCVDGRYE